MTLPEPQLCMEVDSSQFDILDTKLSGRNEMTVSIDHWDGGSLDMDLQVSYDGGATWAYGGGCKGASSAPPSIEFHIKYQMPPTHVRGHFSSKHNIKSTVRIY